MSSGQQASPAVITLALIDDHAVVREGLRSVLEREPDIRVVGEAGRPDDALRVVADSAPSVILLDLKLSAAPGFEGLDLCAALTAAHPEAAVLVLTTTLEDSLVVAALRNGARGYVVKEVDTSELLRAIRAVHSGENAFDPASSSAMVRGLSAPAGRAAQALTSREAEVLSLLARGLSNKEIAAALVVTEATAKFHVANIMRKLGVARRSEAVYVASQAGALRLGALRPAPENSPRAYPPARVRRVRAGSTPDPTVASARDDRKDKNLSCPND